MNIIPTQALTYTRDKEAGTVIVELGGTERNLPYNLFVGLFPRIDRRYLSATVDASARELEVLAVIADISDPISGRVTYELREDRGYNYEVRHLATGQRLVILPTAFQRIAGVSPRAVSGAAELSDAKLIEIGFILNGGNVHDRNYQYANYA